MNGFAHSIEIWKNHSLVGGVYGISIGSVFFAESMFSSISNPLKKFFAITTLIVKKFNNWNAAVRI